MSFLKSAPTVVLAIIDDYLFSEFVSRYLQWRAIDHFHKSVIEHGGAVRMHLTTVRTLDLDYFGEYKLRLMRDATNAGLFASVAAQWEPDLRRYYRMLAKHFLMWHFYCFKATFTLGAPSNMGPLGILLWNALPEERARNRSIQRRVVADCSTHPYCPRGPSQRRKPRKPRSLLTYR